MKYAKSIYRAGDIVNAIDCNYESSAKLGLVCPFCQQAIFLRVGSTYDRQGQQIIMPAAFCHYKTDDPFAEDCELRSTRKDGEEYLEKLRIDSHGQRLDIYNKRLWDIVKKSLNVTSLKQIKKEFGDRFIQTGFLLARQELNRSLDFYIEQTRMFGSEEFIRKNREQLKKHVGAEVLDHILKFDLKRSKYDLNLQYVIVQEVLEFLSTRTGGYAFRNLFTLSLLEQCTNLFTVTFKRKAESNCIKLFSDSVKKYTSQSHLETICAMLLNVDWVTFMFELDDEYHD